MIRFLTGDSLKLLNTLESDSVQCCITSPPYWGLRDYGHADQLGNEETIDQYISNLVNIFNEVRRVLTNRGSLWLNIGDRYASGGCGGGGKMSRAWEQQKHLTGFRKPPIGLKDKDLIGLPWLVAFALRESGWYLRADIIWHKPNALPESVKDRPVKAHEYLFLLTKTKKYDYDISAIAEACVSAPRARDKFNEGYDPAYPGGKRFSKGSRHWGNAKRNRRTVWKVAIEPFKGAHFATFPTKLVEPCLLASTKPGQLVLDPFSGAGTTGLVAARNDRNFIGIELNPEYVQLAKNRIETDKVLNGKVEVVA